VNFPVFWAPAFPVHCSILELRTAPCHFAGDPDLGVISRPLGFQTAITSPPLNLRQSALSSEKKEISVHQSISPHSNSSRTSSVRARCPSASCSVKLKDAVLLDYPARVREMRLVPTSKRSFRDSGAMRIDYVICVHVDDDVRDFGTVPFPDK
jgi:hypothetical protein